MQATVLCTEVKMELETEKLNNLDVIPMIDNKPAAHGEMVGDALTVISLKDLSDDADPDRVVKRNSYRDLHRPNISHLDWVSQSSSKEEVHFAYMAIRTVHHWRMQSISRLK